MLLCLYKDYLEDKLTQSILLTPYQHPINAACGVMWQRFQ